MSRVPTIHWGNEPPINEDGATKKKKPTALKTWELRTLANAYEEREPVTYLVDGLLPIPSLSIVYGAPGSLKSMLLADLAACVAGGKKFLDRRTPLAAAGQSFATTQAGVLWIDFDNGRRRSDERFEAVGRAYNLPADAPLYYVSMPNPPLDANNRPFVAALVDLVRESGVQLIIIDNLGLICGNADENSAEMAKVMGNLRYLAEESHAAVVVVHHQRKSTGNDTRRGETLRGHSSIEAALDLALLIERVEDTDNVTVTPTKSRGYAVKPFGAMFTYEHKLGTRDMAAARFFSEPILNAEDKKRVEIEDAVLDALRSGSLSQADLVQQTQDALLSKHLRRIGRDAVEGIIKSMERDKRLNASRGDKKTIMYEAAK